MRKAIVLALGALAYLVFLEYEATIALSATAGLKKLYTSPDATAQAILSSNR
jgi:hypothetical protein